MSDETIKTKTDAPAVSKLANSLKEFKKLKISIVKDKKNSHFKSGYASLESIINAIEAPLLELNVSIRSTSYFDGVQWVSSTVLEHVESREMVQSTFPLYGNKPQELGSAITYARRYNIQSLLNLSLDDDDDGNEAQKGKPAPRKTEVVVEADIDYDKLLKQVKTQEQYDALHKEYRDAIKALPKEEKKTIIAKFHDKLNSITNK